MKTTKKTVYLPVNGNYSKCVVDDKIPEFYETVKQEEGYFFTPEQLNQLLSDVIKDTLNTAAEKADAYIKIEPNDQPSSSFGDIEYPAVRKKSITNTFEETFNKHSV